MRWTEKRKPYDWQWAFAWLPESIDGEVIWLEWYQRKLIHYDLLEGSLYELRKGQP